MANTPTGHADDLPTIWDFTKITQNREASTFFSAAGFCPKQYKRFDPPAKAPPRSALSDPYYAWAAGNCGLAGPLHGLANQECRLVITVGW